MRHRGILVGLWLVLVALLPAAHAGNTLGSNNVPEVVQEYLGTLISSYVVRDCLPAVPSASLTLPATACTAMVLKANTPAKLVPVVQAATALGPLNSGDGTYWLAVHTDTTTTIAGWTRTAGGANRAGSHYLWKLSPTKPAGFANGLLIAKVTVASAVITAVGDMRIPASYATKGVYDPRDPLYGAIEGTDAVLPLQAVLNAMAAQVPQGGILAIPAGSWGVGAPGLLIKSPLTLRGEGPAVSKLVDYTTTGTMISTAGMVSDANSRVTIRDLNLSAAALKTAGIAILGFTPNAADVPNQQLYITNCWFAHHYTNIALFNSVYAHITNNQFDNVQHVGIHVETTNNPDAGDNIIEGNVLATPTNIGETGILVKTGGQRIIGNKILSFAFGILVDPTSTTVALNDVLISNNSIELQSTYGILAQTSLVGSTINFLQILGNQLVSNFGAVTPASIAISGNIGTFAVSNNLLQITVDNQSGIILSSDTHGNVPINYVINGNFVGGGVAPATTGIRVTTTTPTPVFHGTVTGNNVTGGLIPYLGRDATFSTSFIPFANLAAVGFDGSMVFCANCTVTSGADNTCAGAGNGALAVRIQSVWRCFNSQN